jgi:hypothetical protein
VTGMTFKKTTLFESDNSGVIATEDNTALIANSDFVFKPQKEFPTNNNL